MLVVVIILPCIVSTALPCQNGCHNEWWWGVLRRWKYSGLPKGDTCDFSQSILMATKTWSCSVHSLLSHSLALCSTWTTFYPSLMTTQPLSALLKDLSTIRFIEGSDNVDLSSIDLSKNPQKTQGHGPFVWLLEDCSKASVMVIRKVIYSAIGDKNQAILQSSRETLCKHSHLCCCHFVLLTRCSAARYHYWQDSKSKSWIFHPVHQPKPCSGCNLASWTLQP